DIEEIRFAALAIPPSAISAEPEWMKLARALAHEAQRYPKQADELWEILDEVSRRAPGHNKEENRSRWFRYMREAGERECPITVATVFALAGQHGYQGYPAHTAQVQAKSPPSLGAVSIADLPSLPPKRQFLHGTDL